MPDSGSYSLASWHSIQSYPGQANHPELLPTFVQYYWPFVTSGKAINSANDLHTFGDYFSAQTEAMREV